MSTANARTAAAPTLDAKPDGFATSDAPAAEMGGLPTATCVDLGQKAPPAGRFRALVETTKPGITQMVTITSLVGFGMAAASRTWSGPELGVLVLACAVGTWLSAAGANAINQWMERDRDAVMPRTTKRPIPQGRVSPRMVLATGLLLSVAGLAVLWPLCGVVPMLVSLACIVTYVVFYTPMKTRTPTATYVGAIPGALPPLIGWSAAGGGGWGTLLEAGGLSLFAIMMVWQIPHFLAIAWMYKDDYAKGGYAVLPVVDATGKRTARTIAAWTVLLVPACIAPGVLMGDVLGAPYIVVSALLTGGFAMLAMRLVRSLKREDARKVFFASIIHLPLLLGAMVVEAIIRVAMR